jgi:hypothetical protein
MRRAFGETLVGYGLDPSDRSWLDRWERIVQLHRRHYDVPNGVVRRKCVDQLLVEVNFYVWAITLPNDF